MTKKNTLVLVMVGFVSLAIVVLRISYFSEASREDLRVAAVLPMTGAASVFGKYNYEVTRASLEILSKRFNVRYSLEIGDSKSTPKDAVSAFAKMKNFGAVPNVVGVELSAVATALYPVVSSDKGLLVAIATAEDLHCRNDAVQIYPSSGQIFECLEKFVGETKYDGVITLYYINDDFGQSVFRKFKSKGAGRYNGIPFDAMTDVKSIVAKGNSRFSFVCGYGSVYLALVRELQSVGMSEYIVMSPEFAFPEYYTVVNSYDSSLYYMRFEKFEELNAILSKKLNRRVNPLDFLVFGGYLSVFTVAREMMDEGRELSGDAMFNSIKCRKFSMDGFDVSYDQNGTALYDLKVSKAGELCEGR